MLPYNWQHAYEYRDAKNPWDNPPISSTPVTYVPSNGFVQTSGSFAFEPDDEEYEKALCESQDDKEYDEVKCVSFFNGRTYMNMLKNIESTLTKNKKFREFSKNKMNVVRHRLIRLVRRQGGGVIYDAEVLLHRPGKYFAKHMRVRYDGSDIIMAKVVGSVCEHDVKLLDMGESMMPSYIQPYINIYSEEHVPLDKFPNSLYRTDDFQPLFIPKNANVYVKQFQNRNKRR